MGLATGHRFLARIRASSRLAIFVLLVFALKIGAAAACAKHDLAELGLGSAGSPAALVADNSPVDGDSALALTGTCTHCACHHAVTLPPEIHAALPMQPAALHPRVPIVTPTASPTSELRPPIA